MKKTSRTIFTIVMVLMLALGVQAAGVNENLLKNPNIESLNGEQPTDWARSMWYRDTGITLMHVQADPVTGNHFLYISNLSENDARYEQTVEVEPDTCYRVSARVRASGCDTDMAGAGLSIRDTLSSTQTLHETNGEWIELSMYGRTGPGQNRMTVMARIGGYGSLNVGQGWFDDLSVIEVSPEEAGNAALSFMPPVVSNPAPVQQEKKGPEIPWIALFCVLAILYMLFACFFLIKAERGGLPLEKDENKPIRMLLFVSLAAFALRAIISSSMKGFDVDMNCFMAWGQRVADVGPSGFYIKDYYCDYPPGYLYVLGAAAWLIRALGVRLDGQLGWFIIKLVPVLMDMLAVLMIFKVAKKPLGAQMAALAAGVFALNPAMIVDSAAWGQIDAVLTVALAVSMLLATSGNWLGALPMFVFAILIKPQALLLAPLGLVMLIYEIVASEEKARVSIRIVLGLVLAVVTAFVVSYPFLHNLPADVLPDAIAFSVSGLQISIPLADFMKPFGFLINLYAGTMGNYGYMTINACNLYFLMGMNWTNVAEVSSVSVFSQVLMVLSYIYAGFLYVRAKDRGKIMLVAATVLTMLFAIAPMMHERYLVPALLMLILAYVFDRDIRLIIAFALLSATQFVNIGLVLYYSDLAKMDSTWLCALVSVGNLIGAALMGWTSWEMCVTGKTMSMTRIYRATIVKEEAPKINAAQERLTKPRDARLNLKRRDWFFMIALTLVYAVVAFVNLGSTKAPQTQWLSTAASEQLTFDLGRKTDFHMTYYGGISSATFLVQLSDDGHVWSEPYYAEYEMGNMYRWMWYRPSAKDENDRFERLDTSEKYPMQSARYVRLIAERAGVLLNEVAFLDADSRVIPIQGVQSEGWAAGQASDPKSLIDEQDTVPAYPSYFTGMYFDELYHGRTAYEHLNDLHPHEYTHPPLGKVLIMIGIQLFGMTPFGWRCIPALFGVLMVPLMYLMGKQLFRRSSLAFIGAFLMAVDSMHFTQSRLAVIDVFAVFFIMAMYLFMIRYAQMNFFHQKLYRTLIPLGLSGICMGLAIATKWIGIYGAAGLAVIFFITMAQRFNEYRYAKKNARTMDADQRRIAQRAVRQYGQNTAVTLLFCLVVFVLVPALIYYFSYYWHMSPQGGLSFEGVWEVQKSIFSYHTSIAADAHYFASPFYEWPVIAKPIWYFSGNDFLAENMVSSISCMGNPIVWWGGGLALIWMAIRYIILFIKGRDDRRYLYILIGFLAQYVPWMFVTRATFIYHYFASVPFIILATLAFFEWLRKNRPRYYQTTATVYCVLAFLLFVGFYPLESGLPAPRDYMKYLRWFNWYNYS